MRQETKTYHKTTAQASPNIALIKYWGNLDHDLRIPANNSLSFTLADLTTTTAVHPSPSLSQDELIIGDTIAPTKAHERASDLLSIIRDMAGDTTFARVESENNFPMGAGIASSASAFAALALAGSAAYNLDLDESSLSRLARRASGSAARSICSGFVELFSSKIEQQAHAETIFPADHWDLFDLIAVIDTKHKSVSSSDGHLLADTSPIQASRVADAPRRISECKQALVKKDFDQLARIIELDSNLMHAVMMSSNPSLIYLQPETIALMHAAGAMRADGLDVCYTIDAGPNVHFICTGPSLQKVQQYLESFDFIHHIYVSKPGLGAVLL
jgi:diphosphomevalonate decarboxylase